jgi:hypothetical protein
LIASVKFKRIKINENLNFHNIICYLMIAIKNIYDFTANQILDEYYAYLIDIALKSQENFNINFAKSCYLHVRMLNCF